LPINCLTGSIPCIAKASYIMILSHRTSCSVCARKNPHSTSLTSEWLKCCIETVKGQKMEKKCSAKIACSGATCYLVLSWQWKGSNPAIRQIFSHFCMSLCGWNRAGCLSNCHSNFTTNYKYYKSTKDKKQAEFLMK
jgi:hypothetical protein